MLELILSVILMPLALVCGVFSVALVGTVVVGIAKSFNGKKKTDNWYEYQIFSIICSEGSFLSGHFYLILLN